MAWGNGANGSAGPVWQWLAGIFAAAAIAFGAWLHTSVTEMREALGRIDERLADVEEIEPRLHAVELVTYQQGGPEDPLFTPLEELRKRVDRIERLGPPYQ